MLLTIGMPAYNEEASIEKVVREALSILDLMRIDGEVFILDDCSTDRTPELLKKLSAEDPRVRSMCNPRNLGVAGFERKLVTEARGEWLFMGSSDGETDYQDVPKFLDLARVEGLQAVFGYRAVKNYTPYRLFISWMYNFLIAVCFGTRFRDAGWVKLFHCPTFAAIPLHCQSAFISAERLLAARRLGVRYAERPSKHLARVAGRGRGGQVKWIVASFRDLLMTRMRWFRFDHYYRPKS